MFKLLQILKKRKRRKKTNKKKFDKNFFGQRLRPFQFFRFVSERRKLDGEDREGEEKFTSWVCKIFENLIK